MISNREIIVSIGFHQAADAASAAAVVAPHPMLVLLLLLVAALQLCFLLLPLPLSFPLTSFPAAAIATAHTYVSLTSPLVHVCSLAACACLSSLFCL